MQKIDKKEFERLDFWERVSMFKNEPLKTIHTLGNSGNNGNKYFGEQGDWGV